MNQPLHPDRPMPSVRRRGASGRHAVATGVATLGLAYAVAAQATDVATRPLRGALLVEPNVVLVYDDSGSMDGEIMFDTDGGAVRRRDDMPTGWNAVLNRPLESGGDEIRKLFPQLGRGLDLSQGSETAEGLFRPLPPTAQFAWVRSSTFNRLYYDPLVTYQPWAPAVLSRPNGTLPTGSPSVTAFGPAVAGAALTHPSLMLHPSPPNTMDLLSEQPVASGDQKAFRFFRGMVLPPGARPSNGMSFTGAAVTTPGLFSGGPTWYGMAYYPATFWHAEPCLPVDDPLADCVARPDGLGTLKRYEIKAGITFPGPHASFADQAQNFANWWQYHRKRRLATAGALGQMINGLGDGLRVGHVYFNTAGSGSPPPYPAIQLQSTTGPGGELVRKTLAGRFYNRAFLPGAPTPLHRAMSHVLNEFNTNPNLIQHACQRNYQIIVTDGYATDTGAGATLGAVASAAYTTRLRASGPDALPAGKVPSGDPARPNADLNTNLHLNTYAISLGLKGLDWPAKDADGDNLPDPGQTFTPPTTPAGRSKIDDLWAATIAGKGQMLLASDGQSQIEAFGRLLFDVSSVMGAQGAASYSSVNLASDDFALLASYNAGRWNGDVTRRSVDPVTAELNPADTWSAAARLDAIADPTARVLFTKDGPFDAARVGTQIDLGLVTPPALTEAKVAYLRGVRTNEGFGATQFRPRQSRFGAVVRSVPATNAQRSVAFVAASDGFLHAIDLRVGEELWAYAPQGALADMGRSTQTHWGFKAMHDGSPTVARVGPTEMLFGSLGAGGAGWYALDVSQAASSIDATARASTVKWELPGSDATLRAQMGLSVGRPLLVKTGSHGDVLLLTSGYNAPAADGRGRLFVVEPSTGAILRTLATPVVSGVGDPGLAQVTAFSEVDGTVRYVYGGDEHGNLWRFDLDPASITPVLRLATLVDAANRPQTITARPALLEQRGQRIVLVGTGRILGLGDLSPETRGNSFYALLDSGAELGNVRTALVQQTVTVTASGQRRIENPQPVDWGVKKGWFIDLPADERANLPSQQGIAAVAFVTNQPQGDPCTMNSYRYALDILGGSALNDAAHAGGLIGSAMDMTQGAAGSGVVSTRIVPGGNAGGEVKHCVRGLDGTLQCVDIEKNVGARPKKTGWRRVVR